MMTKPFQSRHRQHIYDVVDVNIFVDAVNTEPGMLRSLPMGPRKAKARTKVDGDYHHGGLREALLAAALEMIDEQGPAAVSTRELARRLRVSHAAPARHFPGSSQLARRGCGSSFRGVRASARRGCRRREQPSGSAHRNGSGVRALRHSPPWSRSPDVRSRAVACRRGAAASAGGISPRLCSPRKRSAACARGPGVTGEDSRLRRFWRGRRFTGLQPCGSTDRSGAIKMHEPPNRRSCASPTLR